MKVVLFCGNLRTGGRERRMLELAKYLSNCTDIEVYILLIRQYVNYPILYSLPVPVHYIIQKNDKKKPLIVAYRILTTIKRIKPNLIHTWGSEETLYILPSIVLFKISLINGQITSAPPKECISFSEKIINKINFYFSDIIISNSYAGIKSFNPPHNKSRVIYNGIDMNRFNNMPDKNVVKTKYNIRATYAVVMVGSFTENKDYDRFIRIANLVCNIRKDISFVCIGGPSRSTESFQRAKKQAELNPLIIITGIISEVEAVVNACDIGVLFSPNGEGISNAILEYIALEKPVIAYDIGGTKEIITNGENGILINDENDFQVSKMINDLIDNVELRDKLGKSGRKLIEKCFTLERMGIDYVDLYSKVLENY